MSKAKKYYIEMTLNGLEAGAFEDYCEKVSCSYTGSVICLIRECLMNKSSQPEKLPRLQIVAEKMERLEKTVDNWISTIFRVIESNEKLEKQIACLQEEIEVLERKIKDEAFEAE